MSGKGGKSYAPARGTKAASSVAFGCAKQGGGIVSNKFSTCNFMPADKSLQIMGKHSY